MENSSKQKLVAGISFALSIPISFYIYKKWKSHRIKKYIESIKCYNGINSNTTIEKVGGPPREIFKLAKKYQLVAVDCEWVQSSSNSIALLQISFPNGRCFLYQHDHVPKEVLEILEDQSIIKLGVGILDEDLKRFRLQWNILPKALVDIRHLVKKYNPDLKKLGVASLAQHYLNITLDKDWRIRASNWEATLTPRQIAYAANDVITVMAVCLTIISRNFPVEDVEQLFTATFLECDEYKDVPFSSKGISRNKSSSPGPNSITNKFKEPKNGHSTLKKPLYDNAKLEAPDGELLCVCDSRKAIWYVEKGLGTFVTKEDSNITVRLNFEPAGRPRGQAGDYYLTAKENLCVVCGATQNCLRKYVVPHEYRKLFPDVMRDHQSHDVLLMCLACHQHSNW